MIMKNWNLSEMPIVKHSALDAQCSVNGDSIDDEKDDDEKGCDEDECSVALEDLNHRKSRYNPITFVLEPGHNIHGHTHDVVSEYPEVIYQDVQEGLNEELLYPEVPFVRIIEKRNDK